MNSENLKFTKGEEVLVNIGSRQEKAIYDCQISYSSIPSRDRFRVYVKGKDEYVSRLDIHKTK